jgi:acyl-CoA thioester hydrolase
VTTGSETPGPQTRGTQTPGTETPKRTRPRREDYVVWRQATTRWADDDVYGHMNNARYFELIDTAVNAHLTQATGTDIRSLPAIGVVAEVSCRYFREMGYPAPVDMGMVVDRVGTSSVIYRIGLFQGDPEGEGAEASAEGRFVHVYVDNTVAAGSGRPVSPVPEQIRRAVVPLLRG